jgi:predicted RNase H-like nuclease (RuvC/YqgF family)
MLMIMDSFSGPMADGIMTKQRPTRSAQGNKSPAVVPAAKTARGSGQPKALEAAVERLEASVAELKRDRDELAAALAAARAEIAILDAARKAAIDRIDWVIDSLHTVLQDKS